MRILASFITEEERGLALAFVNQLRDGERLEVNSISPHRYCFEFSDELPLVPVLRTLGDRIRSVVGESHPKDSLLGWLVSYIEPGGEIHPHLDNQGIYQTRGDVKHLRCNIVLQKDESSGHVIVEGQMFAPQEADLWMFLASDQRHGSTVVRGKPRIVLQYGFAVPSGFKFDGVAPTPMKSWVLPHPVAEP